MCGLVKGHTDVVLCLSVFEDMLLSGSKDNTAILWKLDNEKLYSNAYNLQLDSLLTGY